MVVNISHKNRGNDMLDAVLAVLHGTLTYVAVALVGMVVGIIIGRSRKVGNILEALHELRRSGEGPGHR
jgi:hypothetical protein